MRLRTLHHTRPKPHNAQDNQDPDHDYSTLPIEILLKIFSDLKPSDLSRLFRTCSRYRAVIHGYRNHLPRLPLRSLVVSYGKWCDVLSASHDDPFRIEYHIENGGNRPKTRKSRWFRSDRVTPLPSVVLHAQFNMTYIRMEMVHPDLVADLNLANLATNSLFLDLTHPALSSTLFRRYWPGMIDAMSSKKSVKMVRVLLSPPNVDLRSFINGSSCNMPVTVAVLDNEDQENIPLDWMNF